MQKRLLSLGTLFMVISLYLACNFRPTPQQRSEFGFNGFAWGTSMDTIVSKIGIKPDEKLIDRIRYNKRNAIYEGISGERVSYVAPGNKLSSGTYFRHVSSKPAFDSLYKKFETRYGKPTEKPDGSLVWNIDDTELILYLSKEGTLMASAAQKKRK